MKFETEGAKTVIFEGHKIKNKTWAQTLIMAENLNEAGRSVAFLPEMEATSGADAMILFKDRPVIADFKYLVSKKANTIALDIEQGFGQAKTLVIQLAKADAGQFSDAIDQFRRKTEREEGLRFGNILLMNEYGEVVELSAKELRQDRYSRKIKGFL